MGQYYPTLLYHVANNAQKLMPQGFCQNPLVVARCSTLKQKAGEGCINIYKGKDIQSRKWLLTFQDKHISSGFTHERIKYELSKLKPVVYCCLADEIGELTKETKENKLHTHLFIMCSSPVRASTIENHFPTVHRDHVRGTAKHNRDYVSKTGIWENSEKAETRVEGTFEEWGVIPDERQGERNDISELYEFIKDGLTNAEILEYNPDYLLRLSDIDRTRLTLKMAEYREKWRDITTTYIFGPTGAGKTRSVMDEYGYSNVYAVNDYKHPYDGYAGEFVMLYDEFVGGIRIQDMNNYLDGYPLTLPARYATKQACYEKVFIISNCSLKEQYRHEQVTQPEVWAAFIRRIHKVVQFMSDGSRYEYDTQDYLSDIGVFKELPKDSPTPWDDESASPTYEQTEIQDNQNGVPNDEKQAKS